MIYRRQRANHAHYYNNVMKLVHRSRLCGWPAIHCVQKNTNLHFFRYLADDM